MKKRFNYSSRIEQYLSNNMSYAERIMFEREIALNPKLSNELNMTILMEDAIAQDDILDLRYKLRVISKENESAGSMLPPLRQRKFWYMAAAVLVMLAIGSFIYFQNLSYSNDALFRQYYSIENHINISRSGDANLIEAMIRFHQKEYYNSILLFSQMLEKEPENYAASYYRGISYIEQKSYSQAIRDFNHIIKGSNNLYIENAEWFLCLCLIENNQIEEARTQLEKIAYNPENSHQENAIEILHKINS